MTTYATMRTRIDDELTDEALTDAQINKAILSSIAHYERRPFWFNQTTGTFTTVNAQEYYSSSDLAAIATLVQIRSMVITISSLKSPVKPVDFNVIDDEQDGSMTGHPYCYAYFKQNIRLYPIPDGAYTVTLAYIQKLTALSADGDSNAWTTDAEELIRNAAKRRLALDILHADDIAARCAVLEREALDELLSETRRRRPNTQLLTPGMPMLPGHYNINRDW